MAFIYILWFNSLSHALFGWIITGKAGLLSIVQRGNPEPKRL